MCWFSYFFSKLIKKFKSCQKYNPLTTKGSFHVKIIFFLKGKQLLNSSDYHPYLSWIKKGSVLLINDPVIECEGEYLCVAKNLAGMSEFRSYLSIPHTGKFYAEGSSINDVTHILKILSSYTPLSRNYLLTFAINFDSSFLINCGQKWPKKQNNLPTRPLRSVEIPDNLGGEKVLIIIVVTSQNNYATCQIWLVRNIFTNSLFETLTVSELGLKLSRVDTFWSFFFPFLSNASCGLSFKTNAVWQPLYLFLTAMRCIFEVLTLVGKNKTIALKVHRNAEDKYINATCLKLKKFHWHFLSLVVCERCIDSWFIKPDSPNLN